MPGIRERLTLFLDRAARRGFEWGVSDCVLEVADWLDLACGWDVAAEWRGRYSDEASAHALMPDGLEAAMRAEMARLGLADAHEPRFGDVAVVTLAGQPKPLAAILMPSGRWRMKTLSGIAVTRDVSVLAAWSLPCRP
jgi:hypothetical protein